MPSVLSDRINRFEILNTWSNILAQIKYGNAVGWIISLYHIEYYSEFKKKSQLKLPQLTKDKMWQQIGMLETGMLQTAIAGMFKKAILTISILYQRH